MRAETTLFILVYFFSEDGTVTKICYNVPCCLSSPFKFSSEINIKNPKTAVHLISPKNKRKKKQTNKTWSNIFFADKVICQIERFVFVFRALKLCKHSLNTFLRGNFNHKYSENLNVRKIFIFKICLYFIDCKFLASNWTLHYTVSWNYNLHGVFVRKFCIK